MAFASLSGGGRKRRAYTRFGRPSVRGVKPSSSARGELLDDGSGRRLEARSKSTKAKMPASGEEFRDDVRKRLPADVLAPLIALSPLRSTLAVLQTFGLIALVIALAVRFWSIPVAIAAVLLIAPLQHALFIL